MHHPPEDWLRYTPDDVAVLAFLRHEGRILLIHKKRGLGKGKINGPGGKREGTETLAETAQRETREEVGIEIFDPVHHGTLRFAFSTGYRLEVHIFVATEWAGELLETEEARPFWVDESSIPWDLMWEDDRHWLPHVLQGRMVEGWMRFHGDRMIWQDIRITVPAGSPPFHQKPYPPTAPE